MISRRLFLQPMLINKSVRNCFKLDVIKLAVKTVEGERSNYMLRSVIIWKSACSWVNFKFLAGVILYMQYAFTETSIKRSERNLISRKAKNDYQ
jgi:hypothetical protein